MKKIFFIISIIFCLTPIFSVMAQELGDDAPATGFRSILSAYGEQGRSLRICLDSGNCNFCDAFTVASNIFKFLRNTIAFPVVVLMILYGGVMMIFSGGSPQRVKNGKKAMSSALIGFAIVWGVSLILNTALTIIAGAPISYRGFINGDLSLVKEENGWNCKKDYSGAPFPTNTPYPNSSIPGIVFKPEVRMDGVHDCIIDALKKLAEKYPNKITVNSLNDGNRENKDSYHYKGLAADIKTTNKNEWPAIRDYLKSLGFRAECDLNGVFNKTDCSKTNHIHFDTKGMPGNTCT